MASICSFLISVIINSYHLRSDPLYRLSNASPKKQRGIAKYLAARQCFIELEYSGEKKYIPLKLNDLFLLQKILRAKRSFKNVCPFASLIFTIPFLLVVVLGI